MRALICLLCLSIVLAAAGCTDRPTREELGDVVFEVPAVPGAETPYQLPPDAGPLPPEPELR